MTLEETIEEAAEKFGVRVEQIKSGRRCRDPRVSAARWWIIEQFPDMSANALAAAIGYSGHDGVLWARKQLAKSNTHN